MAYATVTLTGTYHEFDGTPAKGHVRIFPSVKVVKDTTGNVILTNRHLEIPLDAQGAFSVDLPATDDPTLNPNNFGYTIAARLDHHHPKPVSFDLPAALGATTVEDLTPVDPSTFAPTTTYAEKSELDAVAATIPSTAADVNALPDTTVIPSTPGEVGAEPAGLSTTTNAALANTYTPQAFQPSSSLSPLPGRLDNRRFNNSMSQAQDSVTTADGVQYAVWSDSARHPIIGKRTLPDGAWSTYDLTNGPAYLNANTTLDEHNAYSVAVDADGYIHVSGNMHGDWLRYAVSTNPGDITAWTAGKMIGTAGSPDTNSERAVSYPRFVVHPDGTLFFTYRNGSSGNADQYLNRYDTTTKTWTRVSKLIDGTTDGDSPYLDRVVCDRDGTLHVSWTWRPSGGGSNDSNDLCYVRSADKGQTWTDVDGSPVTVPIRHAAAPKVLDTATSGSGLNNSCGLDVDTQGRPHIVNFTFDGGGQREILHIWHDGTTWQTETVTNWAATGVAYTPRPQVLCPANGRTYVLVSRYYDGWRGTLRLIDVTPGEQRTHFPIADFDLRDSEPTFDSRALRDDNTLHVLLTPTNGDASTTTGIEYWADDNWNAQWGAVLSVDLNQLPLLQAGVARRARVRSVVSTSVAPWAATVTATSPAIIPGAFGISTVPEMRGKVAVARLVAKARVLAASTTLTLQIRCLQQDGGGGLVYGHTLTFTSTATQTKATPWIPLSNGPRNGYDAELDPFGFKAGAGNGEITSVAIEYGYLAGPTD